MTVENFKERIQVLQERGYSEADAENIAGLLGDIIEEENGKWIVRDADGVIIAKVDPC